MARTRKGTTTHSAKPHFFHSQTHTTFQTQTVNIENHMAKHGSPPNFNPTDLTQRHQTQPTHNRLTPPKHTH
jgi:hypothetical protein